MALKLLGPTATCGCGNENSSEYFDCCQVLDLGIVYEQEPAYTTDNPCEQTRIDTRDQDGNCTSENTSSPHGTILEYKRACARLVVWSGAKITGSSFNYKSEIVLYSRQREDLPTEECENPIYCPAENEVYTCCGFPFNNSKSQVGGPYNGCQLDNNFSQNCIINCDNAIPQIYKFGMSNCSLDGRILAGYATAPSNWWFLSSSAFNNIEQQIIQNNPYGDIEQTIYAHFQLEWKPIKCDSRGGDPACGGSGRINVWNGRCGDSYTQGLTNKQERERAVRIKAAIGFSLGSCGYLPQEACDKI
jgi:hypothetical protein